MNGMAERFNLTLLTRLLSTLFHANLPVRSWEDTSTNAVMSLNLSPSRVNSRKSSPFSLWLRKPAFYTRLLTFGCKCIRLVTGPTHGRKLLQKGNDCLYFRTLPDGDDWLVWDLKLKRTVKSHDVVFIEDVQPGVDPSKRRDKDWFDWFEEGSKSQLQSSQSKNQLRLLWEIQLSNSVHNMSKNLTDPDADDTQYSRVVSDDQPPPETSAPHQSESLDVSTLCPTAPSSRMPTLTRVPSPSLAPETPPAPRRGQ